MAIYKVIAQGAFNQTDIGIMTAAYEAALRMLHLKDRTDPITELVAKKIIEMADNGDRDPRRICVRAVEELGIAVTEQEREVNTIE
jgi:hypothetical protein